MPRRSASLEDSSIGISRLIGSKYDQVKIVAINIDSIVAAADGIEQTLRYVGAHYSDPTLRQDGSPIQDGDFYLNLTTDTLNYYNNVNQSWYSVPELSDFAAVKEAAELARDQAQASQIVASAAATNASVSETNAASSATNAANSATTASISETNAAASAAAAASDASSVGTDAAAAAASATAAATSATNAATSETNASGSETAAAASAVSANASDISATAAATSATTSEGIATTAATNAQTAFNDFDERYLGPFATAPTLDATGDPVTAGASYWDTTTNSLKFFNGVSWEDPVTEAVTSATAAAISETDATTSALNAATSESNAATSEANAATSAANAATSEASIGTSATNAATSATDAANSATAAAGSATAASISETNAATSASNANTSATNADTSATSAQNSANSAQTFEFNADASASAAATSEANAAASATAAGTSETNALASENAAAALLDSFDDRYLGSKAVAPVVDNDGNPLLEGALYWDTVTNTLWAWNSSAWVEADFAQAAADAASTAADVVTTNANVALTNADVISTNADVVSTNADAASTAQDAIDTAADVVTTNVNVIATNADVVSTNADVIASEDSNLEAGDWANRDEDFLTRTFNAGTPTDRAAGNYSAKHWAAKTAADAVATAADRVQTGDDLLDTSADVLLTNADAVATAADRVQTGLDVTAADASATTASDAADISQANANYYGEWSSLTGPLNIPASVKDGDNVYMLNTNLADVTLSQPSATPADWFLLGNITGVAPDSDRLGGELPSYYQVALGFTPEDSANKGIAGGYAPLDAGTKIASTYLPSYVDDVIMAANEAALLALTPEAGKVYVREDNNTTYRWNGGVAGTMADFTAIGNDLTLGETSTTAYRGDRGKAAYDAINHTSHVGTLTNFESTGIDDNATSTALTLDASQDALFSGNITINKASNAFLTTQVSSITKAISGVSTGANVGVTGSVADDSFYRSEAGKILFSTDGGITAALVLDTSNNATFGGSVLGTSLSVNDGGAHTFDISQNLSGTQITGSHNTAGSSLIFRTDNGASAPVTALTLDSSQIATFASHIYLPTNSAIYFDGGVDDYIWSTGNGIVEVSSNLQVVGNVTGANLNISNWDTAHGWGDHSTQNYFDKDLDQSYANKLTFSGISAPDIEFTGNGGPLGILWSAQKATTAQAQLVYRTTPETISFERVSDSGSMLTLNTSDLNFALQAGTIGGASITSALIGQWNTAFGWGDHSTQNYAVTNADNDFQSLQTFARNIVVHNDGTSASTIDIRGNASNANAYVDFLDSAGTRTGYIGYVSSANTINAVGTGWNFTGVAPTIGGNAILTATTSFGGDVSGTYNAIVIEDDSHNHTIANVDGLQTALDGKSSINSDNSWLAQAETDLNLAYDTGAFYWSNTGSNLPVASSYGMGINIVSQGAWTHNDINNWIFQLACTTNEAFYFREKTNDAVWGSWKRIFEDGYHPNADTWTTARTLTLSGDVSGTSSAWDGSGNATLVATVANNSHTHDFSNITGTVDADLLDGINSTQLMKFYNTHLDANDVYLSDYNTSTLTPSIAVDVNSTSSTNFPTEFGATWGFRAQSGNNASDWQRQFELYKPSDSTPALWMRGRTSVPANTAWQRIYMDNYHPEADTLTTARTISLDGDVTGSVSFDGSQNVSITTTVVDDSHAHVIANVDGLQAALDGKLATSSTAANSDQLGGIAAANYLRSDTSDIMNGALTLNGNLLVQAASYIAVNEIRGSSTTNNQIVINVGESSGVSTGQTGEFLYVNAESGMQINSSPDNWGSGWAGRYTATLVNTSGNSSFPGDVAATTFTEGGTALSAKYQAAGSYAPAGGSTSTDWDAREIHFLNQEPANLTADGQLGYDASIGLMLYKTQNYGDAGHTNGVYMVLDTGNIATDANLELSGNGVTGGSTTPLTISMSDAGIGAGTYGSTADGTKIDQITVDSKGRITAITTGATGTSNTTGDITGVTAGTDLTGGGTSGSVTLNVSSTSGAATADTIAKRNSAGDIFARLIRQTYTDQSTISGGMVFRVNNTTDNYLRVCNDTAAIRTYLGVDAAGTNNYTHPNHPGDDFSVDTGALTGATVVSDIDINVTTDTLGHVTDANGTVSTRTLTAEDLSAVSYAVAGALDVNADNHGTEEVKFFMGSTNIWTNKGPAVNNAGGLLSFNTHTGDYYSQIWFDTAGSGLYHRTANNALPTGAWQRIFEDDYHPNADQWTTSRTHTVTLTGDVTGTAGVTVNGSANWTNSVSCTVADDSHNHVISNVDGLQTALDGKQASGDYALLNNTGNQQNDYLHIARSSSTGAVAYFNNTSTGDIARFINQATASNTGMAGGDNGQFTVLNGGGFNAGGTCQMRNNIDLDFLNSTNTDDGTRIYRAGGNALRFAYAGNSCIFDAVANHTWQIRDSADDTKFQVDPTTGNVTVTGTVDGRDIAADGSKLDGIAPGATANTGDITNVSAGSGLTGGGASGSVTLTVGAGTGITVNADDIAVNYGTTSTTACVGNDSRLSDARACNGTITVTSDATNASRRIPFTNSSDGTGSTTLYRDSAAGLYYNPSTNRLYAGSFQVISDAREKIIHGDYTDTSAKQIRTRRFDFKSETKPNDQIGYIAQEVLELLPEAVSYDEELDRYHVDMPMVHSAKIAELEARADKQDACIEELLDVIRDLVKRIN